MNGVIAWFVRNPVAANLMMMVMVIGGGLTLGGLRQEEFPAIEPEAVQVVVEYRGASPAEIEESICIRIEEAIEGTPDIDGRSRRLTSEGGKSIVLWTKLTLVTGIGSAEPATNRRGATASGSSESDEMS